MKLRDYTPGSLLDIAAAIRHLRQARDQLLQAGAKKAAKRVRKALKSAEGAQRHADRLKFKAEKR